ncbi:alpha/beta hydrolase [Dietzia sp.]|uniref:alpha/beta hydrolase n=1 Tax=Dietzia sp. TaxID=1871616 RepID=UPI002FDB7166
MTNAATSASSLRRKLAAGALAIATAIGVASAAGPAYAQSADSQIAPQQQGLNPEAGAPLPPGGEDPEGNRSNLRPGCVWDGVQSWVQLCDVWSPSMNRHIKVQVQPARLYSATASLYLLDGLRARDDWNAWTHDAQAQRTFINDNITLVMPVGGQVSFYSNWQRPVDINGQQYNYQWETFLTSELPGYLSSSFHVDATNNAIAGLSMGGSAAASLAAKHRNQFKQVSVFSGYMNPTAPGMYSMIPLAMFDQCKCDPFAMWGPPGSPDWGANDPLLMADRLRDIPMFLTAGSAIPGQYDNPDSLQAVFNTFNGIVLEGLSRGSTIAFQNTLNQAPNQATFDYRTTGIHGWPYWNDDLKTAREQQILDVLKGRSPM